MCERYTGKSFGEKTINVFFHADEIINDKVELPYGPHKSITSVSSINQEGTVTALTLNTDYYSRGLQYLELEFLSDTMSPWQEGSILADDYKVIMVAGYGASGLEALPEIGVMAINKAVAEWYLNREDYVPELSSNVKRLLDTMTLNVGL